MGIDSLSSLILGGIITFLLFVVATAVGMVLTGYIVVTIPTNYFLHDRVNDPRAGKNPLVRFAGRVIKNILGAGMILIGVALSLPGIPGPGLLMILFGITLVDFPGKRRLELWLIGHPTVSGAINRLRGRYGKPPIVLRASSYSNRLEPVRYSNVRKRPSERKKP